MTNELSGVEPKCEAAAPAFPEKDYAEAANERIERAKSNRRRARRIVKCALAAALTAVFAVAAYTEIAAYVSSIGVGDAADAIASLAFGDSGAVAPTVSQTTSQTPPTSGVRRYRRKALVFVPDEHTETDETSAVPDTSAESDSGTEPPDTAEDGVRYPIVSRDLSAKSPRALECSNETDYTLDLDYFADAPLPLPPLSELMAAADHPDRENPIVLIIHTHGTESYAPEGADSYGVDDNARSEDITQNVVAVGEVMAEYFESCGIPTVHCTEMFDRDSYIKAYENSSAAVREYLAIYPSIKYIFDVHRDSVISSDYVKYRTAADVDGNVTAQFMCVVGTDFKGAQHPHWRDNLTLAAHLQTRLAERSPSLPRRLSIRGASFYQQYAAGSLLLEIGSCGNSLSEAEACARIVAEDLAALIIQE